MSPHHQAMSPHHQANELTPPSNESTPPGNESTPPSNELTPPSNELTPPSNESTPPSNELTPPSNELTPPSNESTPPGNESTPPSNELTPPSNELTPPSNELTPPSNELTPPSNESTPKINKHLTLFSYPWLHEYRRVHSTYCTPPPSTVSLPPSNCVLTTKCQGGRHPQFHEFINTCKLQPRAVKISRQRLAQALKHTTTNQTARISCYRWINFPVIIKHRYYRAVSTRMLVDP
ncbi:hypothetical protein Pcinc_039665 [Petrolisthes cinctipes]|uniref:Uncharacterized protein n=1 Tax=Petrolisthes cinctipes TaxID=88211 RepID=A0AAE1EKC1_PETCI|nr:hypothetical protein Pcinc_039665 [Petrolisthes cinctipes]